MRRMPVPAPVKQIIVGIDDMRIRVRHDGAIGCNRALRQNIACKQRHQPGITGPCNLRYYLGPGIRLHKQGRNALFRHARQRHIMPRPCHNQRDDPRLPGHAPGR